MKAAPWQLELPPGHVAMTGLGMTSSLGLNVVAGCAAARAGVTRLSHLEIEESDVKTLESVPLKGHTVRGFTDGFEGVGRLLRLADAALGDMLEYSRLKPEEAGRLGFFLCLPGELYARMRSESVRTLEGMTPTLAQALEEEDALERKQAREAMERRLLPELLTLHGLTVPPAARACFPGGAATFALALARAADLLRTRELERCVVGGVDSLVYGAALEDVYELGLVHTPESAVGFFPGEAAAFVLLERADAARAREARVEAWLGNVALEAEPFHRFSGEVPLGAALQRAAAACCNGQQVGLVVANLNGDEWRARDFGTALLAMKEAGLPTEAPRWYPPASFGEVGAATGAVSTCMLVRAFARGHAGSPHALVLLLADDETRSAYLLHAA
ncbi:hypothetical protein JQX13_22715 [Archangium violaceum]|uniref:hypothetical protein n=1 Tax=Archangium violaceum TaxID=83451 RepID=UPI00193C0CA7|nr:hypothetical protein [Archangium violaceum]QRK12591.1 hypothetical protein JQX13_22715 [Archangium violaceum]